MRQTILFQILALLAALIRLFIKPTQPNLENPILLTCEETLNFGDFICKEKFSLLQLHQVKGVGPVILDEILSNTELFFEDPKSIKGIGSKKETEIRKLLFLGD